jgi:flavodoxin
MRALVVYESMFGNTQTVAEAVAEGLSSRLRVDLVEVGTAPAAIGNDVDLLVVGGPTHAFGMSRPGTRQDAARQAGHNVVSAGIGLREWLAGVREEPTGVAAATFDTRVKKPHLPGSAARAAEKRLRKLGSRVVAPSTSFYVTGTDGPLVDGEPERARQWGEKLAAELRS